jgi:hypothetical protein
MRMKLARKIPNSEYLSGRRNTLSDNKFDIELVLGTWHMLMKAPNILGPPYLGECTARPRPSSTNIPTQSLSGLEYLGLFLVKQLGILQ